MDDATSAITDKYTAHVSGKLISMNVARPYSSIATTLEGDVLVVLARVSEPLTGREVAGLVAPHGSQPAVNSALDRLTRQGLVLRQRAGRANLHTINRQHLGYAAVEALESIRARLISQLRTSFSDWPNRKAKRAPLHGSLFGSTARADGDDGSEHADVGQPDTQRSGYDASPSGGQYPDQRPAARRRNAEPLA